MREAHFKLSANFERPCISVKINNFFTISVLFDTGARFPVWTSGVEELKRLFPSAEPICKGCSFSGFGGTVNADIWCFPLNLGEGLIFPTMHALVYEADAMPDLIIGMGALKGMITIINYLDDDSRSISFQVRDSDSFVRNLKLNNPKNGSRLVLITVDKDEISQGRKLW